MRELAHAYTEDTQVKWNGVLGRMELKAENDVKLQQVNVYPDIAGKRIKVKAVLVRTNPQTTQAEITLQVNCAETGKAYEPQTYPAAFPHDTVCIEKEYALGHAPVGRVLSRPLYVARKLPHPAGYRPL